MSTAIPPSPHDLTPLPVPPRGTYRHYKGHFYELIDVARHSETHEPMAVYRPLYGEAGLWVRPYAMFFDTVVVEGVEQPRFARVADGAATTIRP